MPAKAGTHDGSQSFSRADVGPRLRGDDVEISFETLTLRRHRGNRVTLHETFEQAFPALQRAPRKIAGHADIMHTAWTACHNVDGEPFSKTVVHRGPAIHDRQDPGSALATLPSLAPAGDARGEVRAGGDGRKWPRPTAFGSCSGNARCWQSCGTGACYRTDSLPPCILTFSPFGCRERGEGTPPRPFLDIGERRPRWAGSLSPGSRRPWRA